MDKPISGTNINGLEWPSGSL